MALLGKKTTDKKDEAKKPAKAAAKKAEAKKPAAKKDAQPKSEKKTTPKRAADQKSVFAYGVIEAPVFTEKADRAQSKGTYTFFVAPKASKVQVAHAIKALYGVEPVAVRMINVRGKSVRFGRTTGTRKDRKKALVTLKAGDSIAVME